MIGDAVITRSNIRLADKVYIGDTANAKMVAGLTINQGAADDEILTLKSSDVAHGFTTSTETDTFARWQKMEADSGGFILAAHKDADGSILSSLLLAGYLAEDVDTTKSTSGRCLVEVGAYQTSGNALANIVADGNVFGVKARVGGATPTLMILDEDGDLWNKGGLDSGSTAKFGNTAEGRTAGMNIKTAREVVSLTGAQTSTTINIPAGTMLLGASFNVDTAVVTSAAGNTWDADYEGGSTTNLVAATKSGSADTKADTFIVPEVASGTTNIEFDAPGAETFSSGAIEVVAYYMELTSLADA